ncbi:LemA family protein [Aliidiomarina minuta]|uniref:LemA family protein n=1 Tax=Aliidiomarina minuta TaxID=880057 RepID=A0A432W3Q3_9GAMM|nr:LemA family protein [Aliidiomarina minuta]RUO23995.1 LemA family protein [Aliidiomarina minuta]
MDITSWILIAVAVLIVLFIIRVYNQLVTLKNRFKNSFAQIEVQLKRRHDLIPNLVETAKGYLSHERETLESVTQARNQAQSALQKASGAAGQKGPMQDLAGAENALTGAMGRLNVVMEAYPDLKASQNMQQLSEELTTTENRVAFSRQAYNDSVMNYNTYRQSFPQVALAGLFGHGEDASLLEFEDSEQIQQAPKVSF